MPTSLNARVTIVLTIIGAFSISAFVLSIVSLTIERDPVTATTTELNTVRTQKTPRIRVDLHASDLVGHGVYNLGKKALKGTDVELQGFAFVHHAPSSKEHQSAIKKFGSHADSSGTCYTFLAEGAYWKQTKNWYINTINTEGLSSSFLLNTAKTAANQWNNNLIVNPLGTGFATTTKTVSLDAPDGDNVILFGSIGTGGVLAVTYTWGVFDGPIGSRELIEWDMVFDEQDWNWGDADSTPSVYDFQSVCTHELGHAIGMGDLYNSACTAQTMFGSVGPGSTSKRTLATGDIVGVQTLYGDPVTDSNDSDSDTGSSLLSGQYITAKVILLSFVLIQMTAI